MRPYLSLAFAGFGLAFVAHVHHSPAVAGVALAREVQTQQKVDFARDVQPIFRQHCVECHGTKKARGRLRLHNPDHLAKGGQSGPVVVAGNSEQSLLMRRVLGLDDEDRMPLDADPLTDAELAILRGWIGSGRELFHGSNW